jgi:type IV pilus assembly protein PilO
MEQLLDRIAKAPSSAKFGGLAALVALITGLNFWLVIMPLNDEIEAQETEQVRLDKDLAEKQEIAQNLNERRREMDLLEQKLAEALTELPERKDIEELLAQLNDIGKKSNLDIATVEPQSEQPASFYARIPIKMAVAGNYHEIAMFLQEVSNLRRIVNVNNIRLSSPEVKNEKVVLKSEFQATTFRFLAQAQKPKQTQGAPRAAAPAPASSGDN